MNPPQVAAEWREKRLKDDPVKESNKRSFVSFATSGKDSRTTQMFINFKVVCCVRVYTRVAFCAVAV